MWKWPQSRPGSEEYLHVVSGTCHSSEYYLEFAALGWNTSESFYNVFPKDHNRVAVLMSNIIADCIIKVIQNKCLRGILFMKISCYAVYSLLVSIMSLLCEFIKAISVFSV